MNRFKTARALIGGLLGVLACLTAAGQASGTPGSDWLPLTGGDIQVGCTWSNGCAGGYHGASARAIDFVVPANRPVYASGAGVVTQARGNWAAGQDGRGNFVTVNHGSHASRYLHLSGLAPGIGVGTQVQAGAHLGFVGSTGDSTGAHLHYDELTDPVNGLGKLDPGTLLACHGGGQASYGGWSAIPAFGPGRLRNDGYGCATSGTPGDGTFVVRQGSGEVYVMAGEAPVYVSTWDAFGGAKPVRVLSPAAFDALRPQPLDNTYIFGTRTGRVFSVAGGAPVYLGSWDNVGGQAGKRVVGVDDWAIDNAGHPLSHLLARPKDGAFLVGRPSGRVFTIAGGAPVYVSSWDNIGGARPVAEVDDYSIDNAGAEFTHLNPVPADGTYLIAKPSPAVFIVAGGAPIFLSDWSRVGGPSGKPIVEVDQWAVNHPEHPWAHLRARPADGTLISGQPSGRVFSIAGGAPVYVSSWSNVGGVRPATPVDDWAIENPENPAAHLSRYPADGTFLNGFKSGRVFQVAGGAALPVSSWGVFGGVKPYANVDDASIDNRGQGVPWDHLRSVPLDGTLLRGLPSGKRWLINGGRRTASAATSGGIGVDDIAINAIPLPASPGPTAGGGGATPPTPGTGGGTPNPASGGGSVIVSPTNPVRTSVLTLNGLRTNGRRVAFQLTTNRSGLLIIRLARIGARQTIQVTRTRILTGRRVSVSWRLPVSYRAGRFTAMVFYKPDEGTAKEIRRTITLR